MRQGPSGEIYSCTATPEIGRVLLNPKVHYSVRRGQLPFLILSQMNPVRAPISCLGTISIIMFRHLSYG
jgi:hypothetical protein